MSDQATEQSQELSIEDRFLAHLAPDGENEPEEEEAGETAPQENEEEATDESDDDTQETEQADTDEEEADSELVEIERNGKKYSIPKELEPELLLQADYTRKTQEVAEQRKQVEQSWQQLQQAAAIQQNNIQEYARLMAIDSQLQNYQQADWNALYNADPVEFVRLKEEHRDLIDSRNQIANTITLKQQQAQAEQQQNLAKIIEEGKQVLAREIPNWNIDTAKALSQYGVEKYGFKQEEMQNVIDPRMVKVLHKAYLYDQLNNGKSVTQKKVQNLPKVSKPGSVSNKTLNKTQDTDLRKNLKRSGSVDDAAALFLSRYK
jgi:hypothetical protein